MADLLDRRVARTLPSGGKNRSAGKGSGIEGVSSRMSFVGALFPFFPILCLEGSRVWGIIFV